MPVDFWKAVAGFFHRAAEKRQTQPEANTGLGPSRKESEYNRPKVRGFLSDEDRHAIHDTIDEAQGLRTGGGSAQERHLQRELQSASRNLRTAGPRPVLASGCGSPAFICWFVFSIA